MDTTQLFGLISFGVAGLLCLGRRRKVWIAIGSFNLLYATECAMGLRHQVHNSAALAMGSQYFDRMPVQTGLIFGILIFGGALLAIVQVAVRDHLTRVALTGTEMTVGLFAIETISLHRVDSFLYQHVGPVLLIGWIWLGLAMITGFAARYPCLRM